MHQSHEYPVAYERHCVVLEFVLKTSGMTWHVAVIMYREDTTMTLSAHFGKPVQVSLSEKEGVRVPVATRRHDNTVLTLNDLPPVTTKRWVISRKADIVAAVRAGLISCDEVLQRYKLSLEEFTLWDKQLSSGGLSALRVTRTRENWIRAEEEAGKKSTSDAPTDLVVGDVSLVVAKKCLKSDMVIPLQPSEMVMLAFLMRNEGVTVSQEQLLSQLYGDDPAQHPEQKIIKVFICRLRQKLAVASRRVHIKTVWGRGYMIVADEKV